MAKLIARYMIEVYDDGSIKTVRHEIEKEQSENINIVNLRDVTGRTGQILLTVKFVIDAYKKYAENNDGGFVLKRQLKEAMDKTALMYGVRIQSVVDKMTRQLGWTMEQFRYTVAEYLELIDLDKTIYYKEETDKLELKKALMASITSRAGKSEGDIIEKFFENPNIELTLS